MDETNGERKGNEDKISCKTKDSTFVLSSVMGQSTIKWFFTIENWTEMKFVTLLPDVASAHGGCGETVSVRAWYEGVGVPQLFNGRTGMPNAQYRSFYADFWFFSHWVVNAHAKQRHLTVSLSYLYCSMWEMLPKSQRCYRIEWKAQCIKASKPG